MTLFSVVLSIVATALLLPKDVEDRTLYTILAKPVPRLDYLAGKLLGVLLLVFVSLALMDILMVGILHIRTNMVLADQMAMAEGRGWPAGDIALLKAEILNQAHRLPAGRGVLRVPTLIDHRIHGAAHLHLFQ